MTPVYILGIESSCDDTSAAISADNKILTNLIANQEIHRNFGGVVPELASRAHQQNIVPVVEEVIKQAELNGSISGLKSQLNAVAFTTGPGLLGSLLVGVSYAKAFALALDIPLIEVDHLHAHVLSHFISNSTLNIQHSAFPEFPFLCLTVSGGHTQIILVRDFFDMEIIGETIDDAAGEAFDKAAKILGLPYPGGPVIDNYAKNGNPEKFKFAKPRVLNKNNLLSGGREQNTANLDFSFSGLKTSILYFVRDELKKDPEFINSNLNDLCASIQQSIITILIEKLSIASLQTGIKDIAIAGGVSANSSLREALHKIKKKQEWNIFIPEINYSTDNAAMIAVTGYYKYLKKDFAKQNITPYTKCRF